MKKLFIIAMCLVSLGFASCKKENSNANFIGNYRGNIQLVGTGTMTVMGQAMQIPFQETIDDFSLSLSAGNNGNEVLATVNIEESHYQVKGNCKGDVVEFEKLALSGLDEDGTIAEGEIKMNGVLNGANLVLTGTLTAHGTVVDEEYPMPMPVSLTANMNGTLHKN